MVPVRYLTPFAFLALLPLGGWLGGAWTFAAAIATSLCIAGLDAVLGEEQEQARRDMGRVPRWLPRIYILLQLAATAWAAVSVTRPDTSLVEAAGLALSTGFTTGVFGFVAAHEMVHSRSSRERALGLMLLGIAFYMHFRIAHVYGHHRRAATFEDSASARLGEGLYAFLLRSVAGQVREAWTFEAQRCRRAGRAAFGPGNRMVIYLAIEASFLLSIALISGRAAAFLVVVAIVTVALLESFNYVAHYGLSRTMRSDGRYEPLGPQHSWNSARRMNNAALLNMGRHADHHRRMTRPFERLEAYPGAAMLPSGYAAAMVTALVPPIWRRAMDPRARAALAATSYV